MRLAVEPKAGFFALFDCPKRAFGREFSNAKDFNRAFIDETGVVGVHFGQYMRYAVCASPVEKFEREIRGAFKKAEVSY